MRNAGFFLMFATYYLIKLSNNGKEETISHR